MCCCQVELKDGEETYFLFDLKTQRPVNKITLTNPDKDEALKTFELYASDSESNVCSLQRPVPRPMPQLNACHHHPNNGRRLGGLDHVGAVHWL